MKPSKGQNPAGNDQAPSTTYDLPPLVWLRAFEASARHCSFTAAAQELNLTQAAVSHQVRSLEKYLGVVLFERLPRNLRLTEMGSAYLPPLRRSFDDLAAATAGLFGPLGRRTLVVRAPVSFATLWLAKRLPRFLAAYPAIALRLTSAVWTYSQSDETADIDIRLGDGVWPGYHSELIAHFDGVVVCHPDHVPTGSEAERIRALAAGTLVHVTGYEDLWQRLFEPHGIHVPAYSGLNVDTYLGGLELAATGIGPTIIHSCYADAYISSGRLVRALDTTVPISHAHYLLTLEGAKRKKPEALLFRNWLMAEAARG